MLSNSEGRYYRNLRSHYTNCTYIREWQFGVDLAPGRRLDLSFMQHIREVTDYILISPFDGRRIVLPNLQISLFTAERSSNSQQTRRIKFGLVVTLSKMQFGNARLPKEPTHYYNSLLLKKLSYLLPAGVKFIKKN